MSNKIRNIIKEALEESALLCEVKIAIDDEKKRGFAQAIGQQYKESLKDLKPVKIEGRLKLDNDSLFVITLSNGDIIQASKSSNPAYANIIINRGEKEYFINSQELFTNKFPDLVKKYYLEYKIAKAGIPSM